MQEDDNESIGESLQPVHRSHHSNLPLKPDPGDPHGWQARLALLRHSGCPLQLAALGRQNPQTSALFGKMRRMVKDAPEEGWQKILEPFLGHLDDKKEQLTALREEMDPVASLQCTPTPDGAEPSQGVKDLIMLAEIYRLLSGQEMSAVRKAAVYPRLLSKKTMDQHLRTPWRIQVWYVLFPLLLFMLCFALQSFLLHVATAFYVRFMARLENSVESFDANLTAVEGGELFDLVARMVATDAASDQEAVPDGNHKIPTFVLDLSGAIPGALCVSAFAFSALKGRFHIGLWYKTFLIACSMAIIKGVLDIVTVLPDSIGWQQCKDRLGPAAYDKMLNRHFFQSPLKTLVEAISDEIFGVDGTRIRYCADMMVSGHTYFAALFSLAAYKLTGAIELTKRVQIWVGFLCVACVTVEVVLVAAARFHYTVDMIISVILVVLFWDSLYLEQVASDWSEGYNWRDPDMFEQSCCGSCGSSDSRGLSLGRSETTSKGMPKVLPSQATHLINMRMLSGVPSWQDVGKEPADKQSSARTERQPMLGP
ncbi:unnamed protein product [Effrenium voratum]|nr:unnamed protein product [Effrenium voratum]